MSRAPSRRALRLDALVRLALGAAVALAALLAMRQVASFDAGFHLRVGRSILDGQGWPRLDRFTYTVTDRPYIDTSWGYQVILALVEAAAGPAGLVLLHVALVVALCALVLWTARLVEGPPALLAACMLAGVLAAELRFEVRPELASYVLLALVLAFVQRRALARPAPLALLVPLFLLWANLHALFVLGLLALGCGIAGTWLERGRLDRRLAGFSAGAALVLLINPYGWRGVAFPLTLATRFDRDNPFAESIGEFVSPLALRLTERMPFYPTWSIWSYRLLLLVVVISAVRLALARRFAALLVLLVFGALSATMVRNMPLLLVACVPPVVQAWPPAAGGPARRRGGVARSRIGNAVLAGVLGLAVLIGLRVATDAHYVATRRETRTGLGWSTVSLPVEAVDWTKAADLRGPVLNHLNFGGYLMWARGEPVFIDGRLEVMGEAFYERYRRALEDPAELERAVAAHGVTWTIFPYRIAPRLLDRLSRDERWVLVHFDGLAAVFARRDAAPPVSEAAARLAGPPPPLDLAGIPGLGGSPRRSGVGHWLAGLVSAPDFPWRPAGVGLFHYFRGDHARAAAEFAEAVRASDGAYYELYNNLGSALFRLGRRTEAAACYRIVLDEDPGNEMAEQRLAELARRGPGAPRASPSARPESGGESGR